jgi:hypothetical protein
MSTRSSSLMKMMKTLRDTRYLELGNIVVVIVVSVSTNLVATAMHVAVVHPMLTTKKQGHVTGHVTHDTSKKMVPVNTILSYVVSDNIHLEIAAITVQPNLQVPIIQIMVHVTGAVIADTIAMEIRV